MNRKKATEMQQRNEDEDFVTKLNTISCAALVGIIGNAEAEWVSAGQRNAYLDNGLLQIRRTPVALSFVGSSAGSCPSWSAADNSAHWSRDGPRERRTLLENGPPRRFHRSVPSRAPNFALRAARSAKRE
ncbi:unnamed protein product [Prorocentrum cordatum]|uniref:Uncharacterized protein n=1 Tax=Prorocentrum cordatum TaxID=2364126 RepID=A0ABN9PSX6_9DINO|nr:unnamed protein product [Polarella glacialis]